MIVGFCTEYAKSTLLRYTRYLADTEYEDVSVVPDLTKKQRQEETSMKEEAERRNECELTEDDLAKNLCWKVVGQRGEKRLVKGFNRENGGVAIRGRGRGVRASRTVRGLRGTRGQMVSGRGGGDRGKRMRNSSGSNQEPNPPRKLRGTVNRGMTQRGNAATGSNRVTVGQKNLRQAVEQEIAEVQSDTGEGEMIDEDEEPPTLSQLAQLTPGVQQPVGEQLLTQQ
jgi:hypothetical protein